MKSRFPLRAALLLLLVALLAGIAVWFRQTSEVRNWQTKTDQSKAVKIRNDRSFQDFDHWLETFSNASPSERAGLTTAGLELALSRRMRMEVLIRDHPQEALEHAVTLDLWHGLPHELQAQVEEPFSALGQFRVLPVCITGSPDAGKPLAGKDFHDVVRYTEIEGQPALNSSVFGRRNGLSTKEDSPIQGIRLGALAALREEVFHELQPREVTIAESLYPIANPQPNRDFSSGKLLGPGAVTALAGGRIFKFSDHETLSAFNDTIATLDEKPDPRSGAAVLFLPLPTAGSAGAAFNLSGAIALSNNLASSWTETKKKVFMIRCDFSDMTNTANPVVNQGTYGTLLNTTVSDDIRDFSYGKTWIEATVSTNVIRLPQTAAYYTVLDGLDTSRNPQLLMDAKAAYLTANPGFVASDYDIIGVWFVSIGMKSRNINYAGLAGGTDLWIQGSTDVGVHVHEFGHNYGIGHSSFWIPSNGSTNPVDPSGTTDEYGDPFDVMGSGTVPEGVYHSEAKQRLNWLAAGQWTDATAGGSGTYRIYRIDNTNTTGVRGLRITKAADEYYWLSYRRLFANSWLKAGANVVWQRAGTNRSWLIDTTPGSLAGSGDRTDGSIAIGRTYADTASNVYITPIARGGTSPNEYLDIKVNIGPFPGNTAPTATLSGPTTISARQSCIFTAQGTDANGDVLAYSWDFGQGFTFDNHNSAPYSWISGGTYTVKCTVSDMKGQSTVVSKTVTVTDPITTWTTRANSSAGDFTSLAASSNKVIATGFDYPGFKGSVATSSDGVIWTATQLNSNQYGYSAIWDGSQFLLAGEDYNGAVFVGCVYTSSTANAGSWTRRIFTGSTLRGIANGGGVLVAVGDNGTIRRSIDAGASWTLVTSGTTKSLASIAYGGGKFVALGYTGDNGDCVVLTSPNGLTWTDTSSGAGVDSLQDLRNIVWANDRFLASGWFGKLRYSLDSGTSFTTTRTTHEFTPGIAYGNGVWFAAGQDLDHGVGVFPNIIYPDIDLVSTDGSNWIPLATPSLDYRNAAIFFNNTFITAGANHSIRQSGTISPSSPGYPAWRDGFFPDHGPLSAPDEDGDSDSLNNLLEYALGASPVSISSVDGVGALPQAVIFSNQVLLNDRIALQFSLPEPAPADIGYMVEASGTLSSSWTPLATKIGTGAWTWNAGGTSRVILGTSSGGKIPVTVGDSLAAGIAPKRFLRMRTFVNQ
ncbi:MAG: PKD domain-containing protein [Luteolibacter sp.]